MKSKKVLCLLLSIMFVCAAFAGCSEQVQTIETTTQKVTEEVTEEEEQPVKLSQDTIDLADDTKDSISDGDDIATDKLPDGSAKEESTIEDEQAIEQDAQVEQENISYDGTNTGNGKALLGKCSGLTYYSQADSRWANKLYTSTGNKSQTMKSSACGPTSAAMVVSSSKGAILPTTMAQLFVDNGYRTKNNGTAWSCWSFIADYFGFDEYKATTSFSTAEKALEADKNKDGVSDYFVVVSCGSGLFTSSGHYIVLVADNDNTLTVYDPYLYSGKFNTASRKAAKVTVSGNSVYVSESNFKKYANAKQYWIFSNDYEAKSTSKKSKTEKTSNKSKTTGVKQTRYVATQSKGLNVRKTPNGKIVGTVAKGTKVTVTAVSGNWSKIGKNKWVSSAYLSATKIAGKSTVKYKSVINKKYRLKSKTVLYAKGNLTGTNYNYVAETQIKVVSHYSNTVDKVYVVKTGRYAYCKVSSYV